MTKKNFIVLAVAFLAVAAFYLYMYKDSFRKPDIQISLTIRPKPSALAHKAANALDADSMNLNFAMDHKYQLTSVKVVPVNELETNQYAHAIWELISDSNSIPTLAFSYGGHIRGMHPSVRARLPIPLPPMFPIVC